MSKSERVIRLYGNTSRAAAVARLLLALDDRVRVDLVTGVPSTRYEPDWRPELYQLAKSTSRLRIFDSDMAPFISIPTPDVLLCVNWRSKLSQAVIDSAGTALVLHDSLLPKYRGHSPLVHAILNGESETGATLFVPNERIDEGPIVGQQRVQIEGMAISEAMECMTRAYLALIARFLPRLLNGNGLPIKYLAQHGEPSYGPKIDWESAPEVDLGWPEERIERHLQAFSAPYPRAFARVDGRKVYFS